ncbi:MAG: hypothetical protein ACTSPI_17430 [Candidatus Heimdallarchaeaceae archaeon]
MERTEINSTKFITDLIDEVVNSGQSIELEGVRNSITDRYAKSMEILTDKKGKALFIEFLNKFKEAMESSPSIKVEGGATEVER